MNTLEVRWKTGRETPAWITISGKPPLHQTEVVSYNSFTGSAYATDTQTFYYTPEGSENYFTNRVKYVDTIINKLPRVITEGKSVIENASVDMSNYISVSSTVSSFPANWKVNWFGTDASNVGVGLSSTKINFSLSSALRDNVIAKKLYG